MAYDAIFALGYLGENSEPFLQALQSQMSVTSHRYGAFKNLARIDSPEVLDVLERAFLHDGGNILAEYRWNTAHALCHFPDRRTRILPRLWRDIKNMADNELFINNVAIFNCFEFLGDLDQQEVKEFLWNEVYAQNHGIHYGARVEAALSGIARFDPEAAFRVAVTEFSESRPDRELLPKLLMAIDPAKAIPQLCSIAKREKSAQVRWQIGRALCGANDINIVQTCIRDLLSSADEGSRLTGSELAGWLKPGMLQDELTHLVSTDSSPDVRITARESLRHQRETLFATQLANDLPSSTGCQQWCYVKSIVELANPYLLLHEKDLIGFRSACKGLSASIIQYVREQLDKRYKQLDAEAKNLDRNRNSDS